MCPHLPHSINRSEHIGFNQLRTRAAQFVPAARIHDEQAAIGIFDHVGRVEVLIVRNDEIAVVGGVRRAARLQDVPADFAQVELRAEEVVVEFLTELIRLVAVQAARGRRAEVGHHRH